MGTIARLEAVCARLETVALKAGGAEANPEVPPEGYLKMKEVFDNEGKAFIDLWAGLGSKKKKYAEYCEPPVPICPTNAKLQRKNNWQTQCAQCSKLVRKPQKLHSPGTPRGVNLTTIIKLSNN